MNALYDTLGQRYAQHRRPDPRIAAALLSALGDAKSVANIGAGAGSYEPHNRDVIAVEPSDLMISQRPPTAAPVLRAVAETLPFADNSFDAASAFLTVHHWPDKVAGLREMARVARKRCVFFTWIPPETEFWLTRDYIPQLIANTKESFWIGHFEEAFGNFEMRKIMVPEDCIDGFLCAYWKRPEAYLDAAVRFSISAFATVPDPAPAFARLARDLEDGSWTAKNADLLNRTEMDYGYRILIAEQGH
ncbi:MAG: class I SAM-dependent methyltransferase [Proteobacteria bacterium]|nr:class I SAM-dependent methyltransferase [Pseudomonadota bacterium]